MDPLKLRIENFCGHGVSEIDFTKFSIALVIGRRKGNDKISNTVGKTTIFSAIKFVLFNESEFSSLDKLIRHGCDFCEVSLEFMASDKEIYKVIRRRAKKTGADLRLFRLSNNEWIDITQRRNSDTEKELFKLIKMNCKTFCNSVLFSQAEVLNGLAAITPAVRKLIMKDALQLGVYSLFEKAAKKKVSDIDKEIDREKIIVSTIGDPVKDVAQIISDMEKKASILATKEMELDALAVQHEHGMIARRSIEAKIGNIEQRTSEAYADYRRLQQEIGAIKINVVDLNSKLSRIKKAEVQARESIKQLANSVSQFEGADFGKIVLLKDQAQQTSDLLMENSIHHKNYTAMLTKQNAPLPDDAVCRYCKQSISEEHRQLCKQNDEIEIAETKKMIVSIQSAISSLSIEEKNCKRELKQLEAAFEQVSKARQAISSKEKELSSISIMFGEYESLSKNETSRLEEKMVALETARKFLADNNAKEIVKLKAERDNQDNIISKVEDTIHNNGSVITSLRGEQAVLADRKHKREKDIDKLTKLNTNILSLERRYHVNQLVTNGFSSYGIPAMITHTILDDFQIETNAFLSQLKPGMQTQFLIVKDRCDGDKEDTLDIKYTMNGYELEYAQLSGAQKLIASLCLKLGLASVIKKRLGTDIKMLLIDEVDQSLDDGHLEDFGDAIKKLQNEFKIMIITHNKELKDKFSTAIVVEQDENSVSKAWVANAW